MFLANFDQCARLCHPIFIMTTFGSHSSVVVGALLSQKHKYTHISKSIFCIRKRIVPCWRWKPQSSALICHYLRQALRFCTLKRARRRLGAFRHGAAATVRADSRSVAKDRSITPKHMQSWWLVCTASSSHTVSHPKKQHFIIAASPPSSHGRSTLTKQQRM